MTREERLTRMKSLLEPMQQYLHELDEDRDRAEVATIEGGDRRRRRRLPAA
jgi:hypothetical protein